MLLSSMAHDKHDMLEAFLSKDAGRGILLFSMYTQLNKIYFI